MAHGRTGPDLVMNTRYVGASAIRAVSEHERRRTPDGSSDIDPARSHMNVVLHGPATQQEALDQFLASGVGEVAAQAESPYVQIVLSASPSFFRAEGQGPGQWDDAKLKQWRDASMEWLRAEYGDDLAHVSLHLDEQTPHMHVLVIPTYQKKPRKPGRQKRGETAEEFQARKAAAEAAAGVRVIGRASNEKWGHAWSKREARQSYHAAVEPLGLGYGRDLIEEGQPSPESMPTGQWVRERAADLAQKGHEVERLLTEAQEAKAAADRDAAKIRDDAAKSADAVAASFSALADQIRAGTVGQNERGQIVSDDISALRPGGAPLADAARAMISLTETLKSSNEEADRMRIQIADELRQARTLRETLSGLVDRVRAFLGRPDVSRYTKIAAEGRDMTADVMAQMREIDAKGASPAKKPIPEADPDRIDDGTDFGEP
jgi:hypothetical protein